MRALLSWDIDPRDPDFQRILFDLASLLPPEKTSRLTTYTALIDPITSPAYRDLAKQLRDLASHYNERLFIVFSLHPAGATIWGRFRSDRSGFLVDADQLGLATVPGAGED